MKQYYLTLCLCAVLMSITAFAQNEPEILPAGCLIDDDGYNAQMRIAPRANIDYQNLPASFSLKAYSPKVRSQGQIGSCTAWATAYAASSIAQAIASESNDGEMIDRIAYSPMYVFNRLQKPEFQCSSDHGIAVPDALELLKTEGAPAFDEKFDLNCGISITPEIKAKVKQNAISDFRRLFNIPTYISGLMQDVDPVLACKLSLSQYRPVVISQEIFSPSFDNFSGQEIWEGPLETDHCRGLHAMCVVGYDDNKYGGAFEIMNSWGDSWMNKGFCWIPYDVFRKTTRYAYSVITRPKEKEKNYKLDGELSLKLSMGVDMPVKKETSIRGYNLYSAKEEYISGTRYRIYLQNVNPAWVYLLSSDANLDIDLLFPYDDKISPLLDYDINTIALPDEKHYIQLDDKTGTDYLCVLYSSEELNIADVINKISNMQGDFINRIIDGLKPDLVLPCDITYTIDKVQFSAKSDKKIVPLFFKMKHI